MAQQNDTMNFPTNAQFNKKIIIFNKNDTQREAKKTKL